MTDLRGSDTRSDEAAGFRFFETTINGIVWMSLCALYYALFLAYGPGIVAGVVNEFLSDQNGGVALVFASPFLLTFVLWPALSIGVFFRGYLPKVVKAIETSRTGILAKAPEWIQIAALFGYLGGLLAFMVVLAGAAFFQSWLALGAVPIDPASWVDRFFDALLAY